MDVQDIRAVTDALRGEVRKAVVGQDEVIDFMLTSLLVGGHILTPGIDLQVVEESLATGASVAEVARRHDVHVPV